MREEAKVCSVQENVAEVIITRHSACDKCDKDCGLAGKSHDTSQLRVEVSDPLGVSKGDQVIVEMEDNSVRTASLLIYLLPLVGLFSGYFISTWLGGLVGIDSLEVVGMAGSLLFFGLAWFILRRIDNYYRDNNKFQPEIVKIKSGSNRYNF